MVNFSFRPQENILNRWRVHDCMRVYLHYKIKNKMNMHIHYTYICASVSVYVYFILIHSYNLNLFLQLCSHHLQHFLYSSFHMYVDDFRRDEKFVYSRMISISTRRVLKIIIKKKFPDEGDIHNLPPICVRRDRGREDDKEKKNKKLYKWT